MSDAIDVASILLNEGANDDGNAQCAVAMFGEQFLFCEAYGWLFWTGKYWERETAEQRLDLAITAMLKQRAKLAVDAAKEAIIKASIPSARHIRSCKDLLDERLFAMTGDFDGNPDLINVDNGVLNLRTSELVPHHPSQRFTYCIRVPYDPKACYEQWVAFLAETAHGGEEILCYLQMAMGYSFTGYTREECLWYIWGPTRSGKGTFTETLMSLVGQPFSIETDFGTFTAKREAGDQGFDLAPLKPARLVFASESNSSEWLNAGKVKRMTGGNMITCAYKHRDQFSYRPTFKIWLTSNHHVRAEVDDEAVWGRVKVLQFPHSHLGEEDKELKQKLKTPENLAGVLRWVVEGAKMWYGNRQGLITPAHVTATTTKSREQVDFVSAWIEECCEPTPGSWASNSTIYKSYSDWCKRNGVAPKAQRGLSQALDTRGYTISVQKKIKDVNQKGVMGLGDFGEGNAA